MIFRKITFWVALVGIIAMVAYGTDVQKKLNAPLPKPPIPPAEKPYTDGGIAASGLVEAMSENTNIGIPTNGLVMQVLVHVWDHVDAGQPLLILDDRELRAQAEFEQAAVHVAEATLARLKDQLDRLKTVTDRRAVTVDEVSTRENDVAIATAQAEAARAAIRRTEVLIERLTVRAPINGTILQVNIRTGEFGYTASIKPPVVLGNIDQLQVRAIVDEQVAPRVKPGKDAIGYIKGDTSHPINMKFVRIEPFVQPKTSLTGAIIERVDTRVLEVIFAFPNKTDRPVYVGQQMDLFIDE